MRDNELAQVLLPWYDASARAMPWRVPPQARKAGIVPDPYYVWLSEIMLQQTTVAAVRNYFITFTRRWPKVQDLAMAVDADVMAEWAGLGYYARARNLLKCARVICDEYGGIFPSCEKTLLSLPGIGPYTAAAIGAIAFDKPRVVVDGNVERVMARLHDISTPLPTAKPALTKRAAHHTPQARAGDYAQAVMDLGATICTPKSPKCGECPLQASCIGYDMGRQHGLPRKLPKPQKPVRFGTAFVMVGQTGAVYLETRAQKGLLGGMLGWPCSDWLEGAGPNAMPPRRADWQDCGEIVKHTFTHFHLELNVKLATGMQNEAGFTPRSEFRPTALPSVMRKVWDAAEIQLGKSV